MVAPTLICGCGYLGERVARRLLADGERVTVTTRDPARLAHLEGAEVVREARCDGHRVLYTIPPPTLLDLSGAARVVYVSSTGVYGEAREVDETTPVAPVTEQQRARVEAERLLRPDLAIRPAAIYGPGRGVHERMRAGAYRLFGDGSNAVSRIHVDDLAALCVAALRSRLEGAFPVADDHPAPAREVAAHCAAVLGLPMPKSGAMSDTLRYSRRVDGRAIRKALGVELAYRSYREGLDASWMPGLLVRPVRPDDKPLFVEAFDGLSPQSRRQRFFHPKSRVTDAELGYFTEVDGSDHIAYVALIEGRGAASARCVRLPDRPDTAEVADTVVDEFQGRGIGRLLLRRLVVAAVEQGIARFRAVVQPGNLRMQRMIRGLAPEAEPAQEGGALVYEFPLPRPDDL